MHTDWFGFSRIGATDNTESPGNSVNAHDKLRITHYSLLIPLAPQLLDEPTGRRRSSTSRVGVAKISRPALVWSTFVTSTWISSPM